MTLKKYDNHSLRVTTRPILPCYSFKGSVIKTRKCILPMSMILELEEIVADYNNYPHITDIVKRFNQYGFAYETIRKLIYIMEHHLFDEYITHYIIIKRIENNPIIWNNIHKYYRHLIQSNNYYLLESKLTETDPYNVIGISEGVSRNGLPTGFKYTPHKFNQTFFILKDKSNKKQISRFTLEDVVKIRDALNNTSFTNFTQFKEEVDVPLITLKRILVSLFNGVFNKYL